MTKDEIIRLGDAASQLLGSDAFQTATEAMKAEIFDNWLHTNPADKEAREKLHDLFTALTLVRSQLEKWKGNAQVEVKNVERSRALPAFH